MTIAATASLTAAQVTPSQRTSTAVLHNTIAAQETPTQPIKIVNASKKQLAVPATLLKQTIIANAIHAFTAAQVIHGKPTCFAHFAIQRRNAVTRHQCMILMKTTLLSASATQNLSVVIRLPILTPMLQTTTAHATPVKHAAPVILGRPTEDVPAPNNQVYAVQVKNSQIIQIANAFLHKSVALDKHGKKISDARVIERKSVAAGIVLLLMLTVIAQQKSAAFMILGEQMRTAHVTQA